MNQPKLLSLSVVFFLLLGMTGCGDKSGQQNHMPVTTVSVTKVTTSSWHPELPAIGLLRAEHGIEVSSEVQGTVTRINFKPGEIIETGDLLFQLRSDVEQAEVKQNKAALALAKLNLQRQELLYKGASTTKAILDEERATMVEANANLEKAKAALAYKTIRAPFSGMLGISYLAPGQFVSIGQSIVSLQAIDNLYADFSVPERFLSEIYIGQTAIVRPLADDKFSQQGQVTAIDAKVNEQTHNIRVQVKIKNIEHRLSPGIAVKVLLQQSTQKNVVSIPDVAIDYSLSGDFVYVVSKNKQQQLEAVQRYIKVGETRDEIVAVSEGLKAGEQIVTAGQVKLHNHSLIKIKTNKPITKDH